MSGVATCSRCLQSGRRWTAADTDRHCGLCGQALRTLALQIPGDNGSVWRWLVAPEATSASAELCVRNVGSLPVSGIGVEVSGDVAATLGAQQLDREQETTLRLSLTGDLVRQQPTLQVKLVGQSFHADERRLAVQLAPLRLRATSDVFVAEADDDDGTVQADRVAQVRVSNNTLRWDFERLLVMPWPQSGQAEIRITVDAAQGERAHALHAESVEWTSAPGSPEVVDDCRAVADADGGLTVMLATHGVGSDADVRGELTCRLSGIAGPRIRIPVLLRGRRPELIPDEVPADLVLPAGVPSLLRFGFHWQADREKRGGLRAAKELALEVDTGDTVVPMRVHRDPASPQLPAYFVRIHPPKAAGSFSLGYRVVAPSTRGGGVQQVSRRHRIVIRSEVEPRARDSLAIDFGTTYTCVVHYGIGESPTEARRLEHIGDDIERDKIPTAVYFHDARDPDDPHCMIGRQALRRRANVQNLSEGRQGQAPPPLFELFKPDIGNSEKEYVVGTADRSEPLRYSADQLASFFLRNLLLHVRADLGHRLIRDLHVTCPTTFSRKQIGLLQSAVERLRTYGVVKSCKVLLDEANAGAFRDIDEYLEGMPESERPRDVNAMIVDFGGGTIDVAVLEASRDDDEGKRYTMKSLGLTGIRDFGGRNVTDVIAWQLTKALMEALPDNRPETEEGWIPLKTMGPYHRWPRRLTAVADRNHEFMITVAEQYKRNFYGTWGSLEKSDEVELHGVKDWVSRIPTKPKNWFKRGNLQGLQLIKLDPYVSQTEFSERRIPPPEQIGKLVVPRKVIDDQIRPALEEVFTRASNLWNEVLRAKDKHLDDFRAPELFLLAGNSSILPLVWEIASASNSDKIRLGIEATDIRFSRKEAKRKVARGAALYASIRYGDAKFHIVPSPAHEFVLLPIVRKRHSEFPYVFELGTKIPDWLGKGGRTPEPCVLSYSVHGNRLDLRVYESIDHRSEEWPNPDTDAKLMEALEKIGVTSTGKEILADCSLELPDRDGPECEIEHRIFARHGRRYMQVRARPSGTWQTLALEFGDDAEWEGA